MKILQALFAVLLMASVAFGQIEATRYQGTNYDGYKVLISSVGIRPEGFTITKPELFFSSYPLIAMDMNNPYPDVNDWLLTIDGTEHSVWTDSSTNVQTSGLYEASKMATDGVRAKSIDGKLAGKVFARIQAGLQGWATAYIDTTSGR